MVSAGALLLMAAGVALVARAGMGSVAMVCPAYVISAMPGQSLTLGCIVMIMLLLLMGVECILIKTLRGIGLAEQAAASVVFALMLDLMMLATSDMQWDSSAAGISIRLVQVVAGTAAAGIGFCICLKTNVLLPADGLAMAFAKSLGTGFALSRICCDIAIIIVALIFCLFYYGGMRWSMVGPGTALSMAGVWAIFRYCMPWLSGLVSEPDAAPFDVSSTAGFPSGNSFPLVITIARTHGSGGHEIGLKVSERLGIKFYDKELIEATALKTGMPANKISDMEQQFSLRHAGRDGEIFEAQCQIIREASRESCVIIGRCADYVLRQRPYCLNIFARCDEDYAVTMIRNKDNLSEAQAREVIRIKNNTREKHYNHYTDRKWLDPSHYDLVINTAKIGIDSAVDIICNAVENIMKGE